MIPKILQNNLREQLNNELTFQGYPMPVFWPCESKNQISNSYSGLFLQIVLDLYNIYFDSAKRRIKIWNEMETKNTDSNLMRFHIEDIRHLRTYFAHAHISLDFYNTQHYKNTKKWLREHCGNEQPNSEEEWEVCLNALVTEADKYYDCFRTKIAEYKKRKEDFQKGVFESYKELAFPEKDELFNWYKVACKECNIRKTPIDIRKNVESNHHAWVKAFNEDIGRFCNLAYNPHESILAILSDSLLEK